MSDLKNNQNSAQLLKNGKNVKKPSNSWMANLIIILLVLIALVSCFGIVVNVISNIYYNKLSDGFDGLIDGKFDLSSVAVKDRINDMTIYEMSSNDTVICVKDVDGKKVREEIPFSEVEAAVMANYRVASKSENIVSDKDVYNYVFIGNDSYGSASGNDVNADVIMIMSYNVKINKITYYTLDSKSLVYIPEIMDGAGKVAPLGNAYTWGKDGMLLCKTIQENFGIAINGFLDMGIDSTSKSIDDLGGISLGNIDVDKLNASIAKFNEDFNTNIPAVSAGSDGKVKLNGLQATAYIRGAASRFGAIQDIFNATIINAMAQGIGEVKGVLDEVSDNVILGATKSDFDTLFKTSLGTLKSSNNTFIDGNANIESLLILISGYTEGVHLLDNASIRASLQNALY